MTEAIPTKSGVENLKWNIDQFAKTYETDVTKFINACVALKNLTEFTGGSEWSQDIEQHIQSKIPSILLKDK